MDRTRFEQLAAAYGAEARRWPEGERDAALAFAAAERAWTDALLAQERALDRALDASQETFAAPELLARRIMRAAAASAPFGRSGLLALAACALLGVVLGYGGGLNVPRAQEGEDLLALAFDAAYFGEPGGGDE